MRGLFCIAALGISSVVSSEQACGATTDNVGAKVSGKCLLQSVQLSSSSSLAEEIKAEGHFSKTGHLGEDLLPAHLRDLGMNMFGSQEKLDEMVANSQVINITFAGVPVVLRMSGKDNAATRMGGKDEDGKQYGLEEFITKSKEEEESPSFTAREASKEGKEAKINMIDMGGNYGAVSIAIFKKYKNRVRAVVTEPVPRTYFFLRWNLWLNGVDDVSADAFVKDKEVAAVVALHQGVTEETGEVLDMCLPDDASMNARSSTDAKAQGVQGGCDCSVMQCVVAPGVSTRDLLDKFFIDQDITLLKMDCEGCEYHALPALAKMNNFSRIRRLVGELHMPEENLIDVACRYDEGLYMTKVCKVGVNRWEANLPLSCNANRKPCKW